ncbi:MAG: hypothetical protein A3I63_01695 [Betaproteobacteria bacterium RIFCSPLOWO2_02_FULL_66_14]|nr:MAG: hypothetical protein A3I63_01695 [Betaproteobacteria bacterium RIFCSPLOWO2_02_FULL_66_14]
MSIIGSRQNPRVRRWRKLGESRRARRIERRAMIEGLHLVAACLDGGGRLQTLIVSESGQSKREIAALAARHGRPPIVLSDSLFAAIVDTETPVGVAAEIDLPERSFDPRDSTACVFLDGVQDSGNVGAILRSAAAFAVTDVVLGAGCADAWSPRALRAGMGAQFALRIASSADLIQAVARFGGTLICTVARDGLPLEQADLRGRVGWIFGGEGQGVSPALAAAATQGVTIPMPGSGESLNVAAAAAICFYERARQLGASGSAASRG